jgi:hypothetical protein
MDTTAIILHADLDAFYASEASLQGAAPHNGQCDVTAGEIAIGSRPNPHHRPPQDNERSCAIVDAGWVDRCVCRPNDDSWGSPPSTNLDALDFFHDLARRNIWRLHFLVD